MMPRRPPLLVMVVVAAMPTKVSAESLSSLPDPLYAHHDPGSRDAIASRIRAIVYPTLGLPALVPYGGELDLLVHAEATRQPRDWQVSLRARSSPDATAFAVEVLTATRDPQSGVTRLHVRVPARAPRASYDLEVEGPAVHDSQPNAVRVYGGSRTDYRFAVIADHQLWDPSWKLHEADRSAHDWPRRGEADTNRAMARQELAELALQDPEFVVHAGDLLFGLEFPEEYAEAWQFWRDAGFATFMLPGNHDTYATYGVRLDGTPLRVAAGLIACRDYMKTPLDWPRAFALLGCVYGDIKGFLFSDLRRDGLAYWQRTFGPPYYSWDHGDLHFVALNTYDGSPARRHSYALWVSALDVHLGAPAVDNYGGSLGDEQLAWLAEDLARASRAGKTIVVVGHHDPRGNLTVPEGQRYQANQPFPTQPLGLGPFQEWNYDDTWASDPGGKQRREGPSEHSGTRLLRLLAEHAAYYIDGHAHRDEQRCYAADEEVAPGIRARQPLAFLRVTTAASAPAGPDDHWGYRLIEVRGRQLELAPYDAAHRLMSTPAGNLWTEERSPTRQVLRSGLPQGATGVLRFRLPERPGGWRFLDGQGEAPLLDVIPAAKKGKDATWLVGARVEPPAAAAFPVAPGGQAERSYEAEPAKGNRPPLPALTVHGPGDELAAKPPQATVWAGDTVVLSAAATRDPEGDAILSTLLRTPDGRETRASDVRWTFAAPGRFTITVEAMDAHGARARKRYQVVVRRRPQPRGP